MEWTYPQSQAFAVAVFSKQTRVAKKLNYLQVFFSTVLQPGTCLTHGKIWTESHISKWTHKTTEYQFTLKKKWCCFPFGVFVKHYKDLSQRQKWSSTSGKNQKNPTLTVQNDLKPQTSLTPYQETNRTGVQVRRWTGLMQNAVSSH